MYSTRNMFSILLYPLFFLYSVKSLYFEIPHYDKLFGTPLIDITIGSPGQVILVEFDTGSYWTGIDCTFDYKIDRTPQDYPEASITELNGSDFPNVCPFTDNHFAYQTSSSRTSDWISCDHRCSCSHILACAISCSEMSPLQSKQASKTNFMADETLDITMIKTPFRDLLYTNLCSLGITPDPNTINLPTLSHLIGIEQLQEYTFDNQTYIEQKMTPFSKYQYGDSDSDEPIEVCTSITRYADTSYVAGPLFSDYVSIGDLEIYTPYFFMNKMICGIHFAQAQLSQGIIGTGRIALDVDYTMMDIFSKEHFPTQQFVFGVCSSWENSGGIISFGGFNTDYFIDPKGPIEWRSLSSISPFYMLSKCSIGLKGDLSIPQKNVSFIVDTGSTLTMVPEQFFNKFAQKVALISQQNGIKIFVEDSSMFAIQGDPQKLYKLLPTVQLFKDDMEIPFLEISPQQYLRKYEKEAYFFISSIIGVASSNFFVIGSLSMRNQYAIFDKPNNRIAFVPANCPTHTFAERTLNDKQKFHEFDEIFVFPTSILIFLAILTGIMPVIIIAYPFMAKKLKKNPIDTHIQMEVDT